MTAAVLPSLPPSETNPAVEPARENKRPRVWTVFTAWIVAAIAGNVVAIGYGVAIGVTIGAVMAEMGADAASVQPTIMQFISQPLIALALAFVPFQLAMLVVTLNSARRSPMPIRERLGLLPQTGARVGTLQLITAAGFTFSAAMTIAIGMSLLLAGPGSNPLSTAVNDGSWLTVTLVSILLSVLPAVVEEILFRGYIQRRLLQRWSPTAAISVSTLLFAFLHLDSLQHILAVIPLGIVTGLMAHRTNSVLPGMLVHAVHNAAAVGFLASLRVLTPQMTQENLGVFIISLIVTLGLIGLPAVISLLRKPRLGRRPKSAPMMNVSLGQPAM